MFELCSWALCNEHITGFPTRSFPGFILAGVIPGSTQTHKHLLLSPVHRSWFSLLFSGGEVKFHFFATSGFPCASCSCQVNMDVSPFVWVCLSSKILSSCHIIKDDMINMYSRPSLLMWKSDIRKATLAKLPWNYVEKGIPLTSREQQIAIKILF